MGITVDTVAFGGWENNLRMRNAHLELIATLEVGPRILSLKSQSAGSGGENLFCVVPAQLGGRGEAEWMIRGGHRLWLAPESEPDQPQQHPHTYAPDNAPVAHSQLPDGGIVLRAPQESSGVQKELEIVLDADAARVVITHRVRNDGTARLSELAPWVLSVMAAGGICIAPQPALGMHPRDLVPNRGLVLWPFTDLTDSRLYLGAGFITLRQDAARGPFKIGLTHGLPWVAYWLNGVLFVKRWNYDFGAAYPDEGSNCELFTNQNMLEVESLGPLELLEPGQSCELVEEWFVFEGIASFDARNEASINAAIGDAVNSLPGSL